MSSIQMMDLVSLFAILLLIVGDGSVFVFGKATVKRKAFNRQEWLENTLPAAGELFEGDIEMDARIRRAVLGYTDKRSAVIGDQYHWPGGIIPYTFSSSLIPRARIRILQAIHEFSERTCVKFVKWNGQEDYVVFRSKPSRCSSPVGRQGGRQYVTLGRGCTRLGTVLHEMMHALGVIHEQSRPDRDDYVHVLYKNIKKNYLHNFEKYALDETTNLGVPYNYASIMHYRNSAFSKNGEDTLRSTKNPDLLFGQRIMFSEGDVSQINHLYKCRKREEAYDGLIENLE